MPTISWFYGIAIRMFFNDHAPPHFHAFHGSYEGWFDIRTGELIKGRFPRAQRKLVKEWTLMHTTELRVCWAQARADQVPDRIPGLGAEK